MFSSARTSFGQENEPETSDISKILSIYTIYTICISKILFVYTVCTICLSKVLYSDE